MDDDHEHTTKPLSLGGFVNLIGPRRIKGDRVRERLRAFARSYQEHRKTAQEDFPDPQSAQAWLDSFEAYERLVHLAHQLEDRGVLPLPDPLHYAEWPEFTTSAPAPAPPLDVDGQPAEVPAPVPFSGFEGGTEPGSGGGGGGADWSTSSNDEPITPVSAREPAPEPAISTPDAAPLDLSDSLGIPDPVDPVDPQ